MNVITPFFSIHPKYVLPNGEVVPSVTQVLNAVIAKPGLQKWANQLGLNLSLIHISEPTRPY